MQERLGQTLHAAVHPRRLVYGVLDEPPRAAPEQPQLIVGIESAVLHPGAPEDVAAGDTVAVGRPIGVEHAGDTITKLGRHALVRVERQHPGSPRVLQGGVLLAGEARPWSHPHPVREFPGELHGLVGGLGIHHDDLVGPGHAFQTLA
jgi:hypothetical protein